jgi:F0F1-type ATP synthase assembly protein I
MSHSILLLPFIFAFLIFAFRFYARENAASMMYPSFQLALATSLIAGLYLVLGVLDRLPPYGELGFGLVGLVLLGVSILRLFMI